MPGLGRVEPPSRRSFRVRLLLLALLPLGVVLPLLLAVLAIWGGDYFDRLLTTKVRTDLAVAHGYFERVTDAVGSSVEGLANSVRLGRALVQPADRRAGAIAELLAEVRLGQRLDFLRFLDVDRSNRVAADWPVIKAALAGVARTETEIFSAAQLRQIDPVLAERALTPLIATANAQPDQRQMEDRGLMVHSAAAVRDADGHLLGVLEGGVLLNKNLAFIDRLNDIVYPAGALPVGSAGTATLFLGDVRVATNVRLFEGGRAIGTRVSAAVHAAVLDEGRTWLDRAFVVNDWYVSAYEPLLDSHEQRIGMLYVGFLDGPFAQARQQTFAIVVGLFALAMGVAAIFAVIWARRVFRPIERMHTTMHAIERGDADARVGEVETEDELGVVAAHFDQLLDRLQAQAESL